VRRIPRLLAKLLTPAVLDVIEALIILEGLGEEATSRKIAELTGRDPSTVRRVLARLSELGLLERKIAIRSNGGYMYEYEVGGAFSEFLSATAKLYEVLVRGEEQRR